MIRRHAVLNWNLDDATQDGYLHTRSFPISLGGSQEFSEVKEKRIPIIMLWGESDEFAIVAISRKKYPGEMNSIGKGSKNEAILNEVIEHNPFLKQKEIIGFSRLYRKMLNLIKDTNRQKILIRKGVKVRLFATESKFIYKLDCVDDGLDDWRDYRAGDYISKEKVDLQETKKVKSSLVLPFKDLSKKIANKKGKPIKSKVYSEQYIRDPHVVAFALKRSQGVCELCGKDAPFFKESGEFYLEVHHLIPLSSEGEDNPSNVSALCPNCHRMLHHGKQREKHAKILLNKIKAKTSEILS